MIILTLITAVGFCILIYSVSIKITASSLKKEDEVFNKIFWIVSVSRFFIVLTFIFAGIKLIGFPTELFVLSVSFLYISGLIIEIICINIQQKRLNLQIKNK